MARFLFYDDKLINILLQDEKPAGGAAVQTYGWIRGLSEAGQEIFIMTNTHQPGLLKEEFKDTNLVPLYDEKKGIRWIRWIYHRLPFIYKKIKQTKPDYLYQSVPGWASFLIGLICRQLNIKYILRISNDFLLDDRFYHQFSKTHRFFQTMGIKLCHCVLCQNEYQFNIIKNKYKKNNVLKISNPIILNPDKISNDTHSRKYIAWIGLFQYQKNMKLLFEIAGTLKNEQFYIAGKETPGLDKQSDYYFQKLKILPNVKFVGFLSRDQVLPYLSKAKFLLNTSHYEGFSNTFLEAMIVKTPIITNKNVNPDSIISAHNLGIVYTDLADLENQYLSLTPESYEKMSNNVLDYVLENHEYKYLANKLLNFLNSN